MMWFDGGWAWAWLAVGDISADEYRTRRAALEHRS